MTFIPFYDKIEIEPVKREGILQDNGFLEMGKVIAVGENVKFVEVGDTLFFTAHGVWETAEVDGVKHHVIPEESEYILGKVKHVEEK